jgi:hypothetical protein
MLSFSSDENVMIQLQSGACALHRAAWNRRISVAVACGSGSGDSGIAGAGAGGAGGAGAGAGGAGVVAGGAGAGTSCSGVGVGVGAGCACASGAIASVIPAIRAQPSRDNRTVASYTERPGRSDDFGGDELDAHAPAEPWRIAGILIETGTTDGDIDRIVREHDVKLIVGENQPARADADVSQPCQRCWLTEARAHEYRERRDTACEQPPRDAVGARRRGHVARKPFESCIELGG